MNAPICRVCLRIKRDVPLFVRYQSNSSPSASKGKAKAEVKVPVRLQEAALDLKAIHRKGLPWAAYELEVHTLVNPSQNMNALRGRIFPPHQVQGRQKSEIIVVFAQGKDAENATAAGATVVGGSELAQKIIDGEIQPDKVFAHPSMMSVVNPLARFLGPKGLMPSTRRGTVTEDLSGAMQDAKGGLDWKADDNGVVRTSIGRLHMEPQDLVSNVQLLVSDIADLAAGSAGQSATTLASSSFTADAAGASVDRKKKAAISRILLSATQGPSYLISDAI